MCDQDAYAATGQKCSAQSILFAHDNWMNAGLVSKMEARGGRGGHEASDRASEIARLEAELSALPPGPRGEASRAGLSKRLAAHRAAIMREQRQREQAAREAARAEAAAEEAAREAARRAAAQSMPDLSAVRFVAGEEDDEHVAEPPPALNLRSYLSYE